MLELLAPGGSPEGLKAAVNAGADAIYMGGRKFGARAYAQNPEEKELLDALDYCHLHGRKLYLTVNTLLKEAEVERELYDYLLPIYRHGLDAVLVQDFGVFHFLQKHFPDLPLHASTQMTISGTDGAALLKRMGAERIVPSRELSLSEISRIHQEVDIEIECFVHGALCYCYSGQCLMSSIIGGRSGNRGRCAQPCRLPYDLYDGKQHLNRENQRYLLSLKDICTLKTLPDLIEAGVCSFKMEGRMKRPEYAAGVTMVYRKYLDRYKREGREGYVVDPEDERILMDLYNRGGFSGGYYHMYNGRTMMSMERPNHRGTPAAKAVGFKNGQLRLKALEELWPGDLLEIDSSRKEPKELTVKETVASGKEFSIAAPYSAKKGQIFPRVRCEALLQRLQEQYIKNDRKEKIKGNFILKREEPAILTVEWNGRTVSATGELPQPAANRPIEESTVRRQLTKTGNTPFLFETLGIELEDGLFYPMQSLNELRRSALESLQAQILGAYRRNEIRTARETRAEKTEENQRPDLMVSVETPGQLMAAVHYPSVAGIYLDCCMFQESGDNRELSFGETADLLHRNGKKCYLMMPMIWREPIKRSFELAFSPEEWKQADGFLLRSSEQIEYFFRRRASLGEKMELIADAGIYTHNREARKKLEELGISRDTLPLEANRKELQQRGCQGSEMIVYGRLPLMVTSQCLVKNTIGCRKEPGIYSLTDRKHAQFPVKNRCSICTNIIYNSVPLELISDFREILELNVKAVRLSFTVEDEAETRRVIREAETGFLLGQTPEKGFVSGTRGHFKRGVE